ncbi:MAG: patatin-like phospholipase family protein [Cyanobacteriota bacterium]|nr:patatin-like phospholipase family protein [Cyanobacteriota bacterium]
MPFRILALDGGGIRGAISARILQEVEDCLRECYPEKKNLKLNQYFDLIAGTSTGSILAAGLASGMNSQDLQKVYLTRGEEIFPYQSRFSLKRLPFAIEYKLANLKAAFAGIAEDFSHQQNPLFNPTRYKQLFSLFKNSPKFPHTGLIQVLKEHLHDLKITEIEDTKLLILAYDTFYKNTTFFTNYKGESRWFDDVKLWEICVSSSSAPTFFPPYEFNWKDPVEGEQWKFPHVDGGVSANNPALAAVIHAMYVELNKLEDISVLSVGTGRTTDPYDYNLVKAWGLLDWAQQIPNIFMGGQAQLGAAVCRQLIKAANPNAYLRLQFELNQRFDPDIRSGLPRRTLRKSQQYNEFLYEDNLKKGLSEEEAKTTAKVSEEIDDGREENVKKLIATAEAFVKSDRDYTTDDQGNSISLRQAIVNFIENNRKDREDESARLGTSPN